MAWDYFVNQAEADLYFSDERLDSTAWTALLLNKEKCMNMAYNRIFYAEGFSLPTMAAATPAQLVILKKAVAEMAYYLAIHISDEDRRKGIQAQGVIEAGIVQEKYDPDWLDKLPTPPFVLALLNPFKTYLSALKSDIDRNENYSVDEDVTGL